MEHSLSYTHTDTGKKKRQWDPHSRHCCWIQCHHHCHLLEDLEHYPLRSISFNFASTVRGLSLDFAFLSAEAIKTAARVPMAHAISKRIVLFSDMCVGVYVRDLCPVRQMCTLKPFHSSPSAAKTNWLLRFSLEKERKNYRSRLLQPCKEEELGFEAHGKRRLPSICIFF